MSTIEWVNFTLWGTEKRVVQLFERIYKQKLASCKQVQIHVENSMEEAKWMSKRLNVLARKVTVFCILLKGKKIYHGPKTPRIW
jgi:hypothetical protein